MVNHFIISCLDNYAGYNSLVIRLEKSMHNLQLHLAFQLNNVFLLKAHGFISCTSLMICLYETIKDDFHHRWPPYIVSLFNLRTLFSFTLYIYICFFAVFSKTFPPLLRLMTQHGVHHSQMLLPMRLSWNFSKHLIIKRDDSNG